MRHSDQEHAEVDHFDFGGDEESIARADLGEHCPHKNPFPAIDIRKVADRDEGGTSDNSNEEERTDEADALLRLTEHVYLLDPVRNILVVAGVRLVLVLAEAVRANVLLGARRPLSPMAASEVVGLTLEERQTHNNEVARVGTYQGDNDYYLLEQGPSELTTLRSPCLSREVAA